MFVNSSHGERGREIYSHDAGNQKGFHTSKLASITNNIIMHRLEHYDYYYYCHFSAPWTVSGTTQISRYQKGKTRSPAEL